MNHLGYYVDKDLNVEKEDEDTVNVSGSSSSGHHHKQGGHHMSHKAEVHEKHGEWRGEDAGVWSLHCGPVVFIVLPLLV